MENSSGTTHDGDPYVRMFLPEGVLMPGQTITVRLVFRRQPQLPAPNYTISLLSGQGNP